MTQSRHSQSSSAAGPSRIPKYLAAAPRLSSSSSQTSHSIRSPRVSSGNYRSNGGPRKSSAFDSFDAPSYCNDMAVFIAEQLAKKSKYSKEDDYRIADVPNDGWRGTSRKKDPIQLADVSVQTTLDDEGEDETRETEEDDIEFQLGESQDDIDFARTRKTKEAAEAFLHRIQGEDAGLDETEKELEKQALNLFGTAADVEEAGEEDGEGSSDIDVQPEVAAQIAGMLANQKTTSKQPLIEIIESSEAEESDEENERDSSSVDDSQVDGELEDGESAEEDDEDERDDEEEEEEESSSEGRILYNTHGSKEFFGSEANELDSDDEGGEDEEDGEMLTTENQIGNDDYSFPADAISHPDDVGVVIEEAGSQGAFDEDQDGYTDYANDVNIYQDEGRLDTRGNDSEDAIELLDSDDEQEADTVKPSNAAYGEGESIEDTSMESNIGVSANLFEQGEEAPASAPFWTADGENIVTEDLAPPDGDMAANILQQEIPQVSSAHNVDTAVSQDVSATPPPPSADMQHSITSGDQLISLKSEIETAETNASRPASIAVLPGTPRREVSFEVTKKHDQDGNVSDARELLDIKEAVNEASSEKVGRSLGSSLRSDVDSLPHEGEVLETVEEEKVPANEEEEYLNLDDEAAGQEMIAGEIELQPTVEFVESEPDIEIASELLDEIMEAQMPSLEAILTDNALYSVEEAQDEAEVGNAEEAVEPELNEAANEALDELVEKALEEIVEEATIETASEAVKSLNQEEKDTEPINHEEEIVTPRRSGRVRIESRANRSPSPLIGRKALQSPLPKAPQESISDEALKSTSDSVEETHAETTPFEDQEGVETEGVAEDIEDSAETEVLEFADEEDEDIGTPPPASPVITRGSLRSAASKEKDETLVDGMSNYDNQISSLDSVYSNARSGDESANHDSQPSIDDKATPRRSGRRRINASSDGRSSSPVITKRSLRSATPTSSINPTSYDSFMTSSTGDLGSSFDDKLGENSPLKDASNTAAANSEKAKGTSKRSRPSSKVTSSKTVEAKKSSPVITRGSLRSATPRATSETPSDMSVTASGKKKRRSPRKSDPGGDLADFIPEIVEEEVEGEVSSPRPRKKARTEEAEKEPEHDTVEDEDVLDTSILEEGEPMEVDEPDQQETVDEQNGDQEMKGKPTTPARKSRRSGPRKSADPTYKVDKAEQSEDQDEDAEAAKAKSKKAEGAKLKKEAEREKRRLEREEKKKEKEVEVKEAKEAEKEAAGVLRKRKVSEDAKTFRPEEVAEEEEVTTSRGPMTRRQSRRAKSQTPGV